MNNNLKNFIWNEIKKIHTTNLLESKKRQIRVKLKILNEGKDFNSDLIEYDIPEWALPALVNGDLSGLTEDDIQKLKKFTERVKISHGNANFLLGDIDKDDNKGFLYRNDIDNLGSNVYSLYIMPNDKDGNEIKESKDIKSMYRSAGMKPPKGKGIHTKKFHKCVTSVGKTGSTDNPYAVCMSSLGKEKAVKSSHRTDESTISSKKSLQDKYIEYLNELQPGYESEEWIIGGENRAEKWFGSYGSALKRFDPIAFQVGFNEWKRSNFNSINENKEEFPLDLEMVIYSHLSDIQHMVQSDDINKRINFVKTLVSKLNSEKKEISEKELNDIWNKLHMSDSINEQWENDDEYIGTFEFEDIPDMQPGGEAHKAFMSDLEKEPKFGEYKKPTDQELKNLIRSLQIANLDLPNEQELIRMAEKNLNRHLYPTEKDEIKSTKERMEKLAGQHSYN
ncbi:MAG: hypothetical protein WC466_09115 [Candidatus Izemoplasmatales bacterium]